MFLTVDTRSFKDCLFCFKFLKQLHNHIKLLKKCETRSSRISSSSRALDLKFPEDAKSLPLMYASIASQALPLLLRHHAGMVYEQRSFFLKMDCAYLEEHAVVAHGL